MSGAPLAVGTHGVERTTRRIQYYLASSLDGFIAREDGRVDWLPTSGDFGFREFYGSIDTVILGRKTWDQALVFEPNPFAGKARYVFSRSRRGEPREGVRFMSADVAGLARELRAIAGTNLWLVGGSELAAAFFAAGLVDDVIVTWVPILLGSGIPMFRPQARETRLEKVSVTVLRQGLVQMRYRALPSQTL
jgi:dihydrofolate reductase